MLVAPPFEIAKPTHTALRARTPNVRMLSREPGSCGSETLGAECGSACTARLPLRITRDVVIGFNDLAMGA